MSYRLTNFVAILLLALMAVLSIGSMKNDSAIMDEVAHLPAGYSYLTQKDYRLNPEHPPLIKDLAALPLLFMKINFPGQLKAWTRDINSQWDFGFNFMYRSGNNADQMLFYGRLPILLVSLLLGFFIFKWTRRLYGDKAGLLALFLYALSPTVIAHSRFVTTDIAAAAAFFIALYYFINWLKQQTFKNLIIAGVTLGLALLMKFSVVLLLPLFIFLATAFIFIYRPAAKLKIFTKLFAIFIIAFIVIWPIYQYHIFNYPIELQQRDIKFILAPASSRPLANTISWMADKPVLRPYAQYFLGLAMVAQRATGGNTTYFLGEISNQGWKNYFPVVYLIKEPLAIHLLTLIVLFFIAFNLPKNFYKISTIADWLKKYFTEFAALSFLGLYWFSSLTSNLNIGVRHILPTFPFVYLLISGQIIKIGGTLKTKKLYNGVIFLILLWLLAANLSIYPSYLAYFNELIGGAKNGYLYVVDSNLDWGQDLKRLAQWVDRQNIAKIKVDYFGGGEPEYYLKNKFMPLHSQDGPQKGWLAISTTFYQTSKEKPLTSYQWLDAYQPVAKIGYSIFVYYIK